MYTPAGSKGLFVQNAIRNRAGPSSRRMRLSCHWDAGAVSAPANVEGSESGLAHRDHLAAQAAELHSPLKLREADAVFQESPSERGSRSRRPGSR